MTSAGTASGNTALGNIGLLFVFKTDMRVMKALDFQMIEKGKAHQMPHDAILMGFSCVVLISRLLRCAGF